MGQARNTLLTLSQEEEYILKRLAYPQRVALGIRKNSEFDSLLKRNLITEVQHTIDTYTYNLYARTKAGTFIASEERK